MAHIIVLGNEKGGSGKSTTSMHIMTALFLARHKVGVLDLDLRQQSFFRYLDNRAAYNDTHGKALSMPERISLKLSEHDSRTQAKAEEEAWFRAAIAKLAENCAFILVDCPGAHTNYAQAAHSMADTLVTPMNDSLVDFDLLARIDPDSGRVLGPSVYSEMVWKARQRRAEAGEKAIDWVVLRNRMSVLNARNKRKVGDALADLSKRIGFRLIPGFSERVIFREMFLDGLTLLDLVQDGARTLTLSNIAARQEVRELLRALNLPDVEINF